MVINDCLIGVIVCMRFLDRGWIGLGWRSRGRSMCMEREGMTACLVSHCACRVGVSHRHHQAQQR